MALWRQRSEWLMRGFITTSKNTASSLSEMIAFANGDTTSSTVVHWCLMGSADKPACCNTDQEALCKFLSHAVPFFSRGYETPLLYRMKGYGPASSFVSFGCCFFRMLPRILQRMAQRSDPGSECATLADALMTETSFRQSGNDGADTAGDFEHILADALDMNKNYSAQNSVRRRLVVEEISKPSFPRSVMAVDALIQPIEHGVNYMLGHTKILHDLGFLGRSHPQCGKLQEEARHKFLHTVSGNFGNTLVKEYVDFLQRGLTEAISMGLEAHPALLNQIFQLVIVCMTDLHRRLVYEFRFPPWSLFGLLDLDTAGFVQAWTTLQAKKTNCSKCLDSDFSAILLSQFLDLKSKPFQEQDAARREVQGILQDIATWTPLSSDSVEIKNGQTQWSASKRGSQNVKNPRVAAETTLLQSAVKQHAWIQEAVSKDTLPSKAVVSGIQKMVGVGSSNQHTKD